MICILGPLVVDGAGEAAPSGQTRHLLCWLTLHRDDAIHVDRLASLLWHDRLPDRPRREVQTLLGRASGAVERIGEITITDDRVRLDVEPGAVDAEQFADVAHDEARSTEELIAARSLWRGSPYLEIADHPDARPAITHLDLLHAELVERIAARALEVDAGDPSAMADLERIVAEHPERVSAWTLLVRSLHRSGRRLEAMRTLDRLRVPGTALSDPVLQALEAEILAG